jgi:histidine triad (HIT) family protein
VEITDFSEDLAAEFFKDLIKVASIIKSKLSPDGINIVQNNGKAAGQEVLHAHFHIIPRKTGDGIIKLKPRENKPTQEELKAVLEKLQ